MKEVAEMLMSNTEQKNLFFSSFFFPPYWIQLQMMSKYRPRVFIGVFSSEPRSPRSGTAAPAPPVQGPDSVPRARAGLCRSTDSKNTQNN